MYLASLKQKYKTKEMVTTFKGYSHREVIGDGEWYEMTNMSARKYPAITTRPKRQFLSMVNGEAVSNVAAMVDMDGLVWLGKDGSLHAGGHRLENFYTYTEADRQLVPMGGYLVVFPDKVWANAVKLRLGGEMVKDTDYGRLEAKWEQEDDANTLPIDESNGILAYNCKPNGERWDYIPSTWAVLDEWPEDPITSTELEGYSVAIVTNSFPYKKYYKMFYWAWKGDYHFGYLVSDTNPTDPEDGAICVNNSGDKPVLQKWFATTKMWSAVETYTRLESAIPFDGITVGDTVKITLPGYHYTLSRRTGGPYLKVSKAEPALNAIDSMDIKYAGEDDGMYYLAGKGVTIAGSEFYGSVHSQLVATSMLYKGRPGHNMWTDESSYLSDKEIQWVKTNEELSTYMNDSIRPVKIERAVPDMDYVTECGNRLWGCFYGEKDGKILNEIYASKLGDFKNWNSFQGLSTDSYAASRGTDGPWTGAITMNNYPLFFKRNCLEKVYVSASGAHQIATTKLPGVQPGSWRSMQIVDGVLIYLSDTGVMVYDGSLPDHISSDFGEVKYKNGVAGKQGYNYYLSVEAQDGTRSLFNLDTTKGVWNREDDTQLVQAADRGDVLYMLTADGRLMTPGALAELDTGELEEDFTWEIISGAIGYQRAEQEYLLRLIPRIKLEPGGSAVMHVMYDDNGDWQRVGCIENYSTHSVTIPVKTRRCDHFRIKLSGIGGATLYTIVREIEKGSLEG